jgi:uroporphyrin-III C-methyltransferase
LTQAGKVYLVGAGLGDPELLTLKAARILGAADVVVYDRLVSAAVLAMARPDAELIYAGKEYGEQDLVQDRIFAALVNAAEHGKTVVRLKSGDPMIFGRGGEEVRYLLERGIDCEVIPGISSAIAAPALAGVPLTYRGVAASFTVVAGHRQSVSTVDWNAYRGIDTLVVLMGVEHRDVIAGSLMMAGRPAEEPVLFIERASTPEERLVESTLAETARRRVDVSAPAVMVIGAVVRFRNSPVPGEATSREVLA